MATVTSIATRALRLLRVIDAQQALRAEEFETACAALNAMMARWEANGLALGWQQVHHPGDALPAPPEAEQAIAFNLAVVLRPEYGVPLEPDIVAMAREGLAALMRDVLVAHPVTLRLRLPSRGRYCIRTDSDAG